MLSAVQPQAPLVQVVSAAKTAPMRRLLIFPLMPLFLIGHYSGESRRPILGTDTRVEAVPVSLDAGGPTRTRIGPLTLLGGWQLRGPDDAFGGFSAMAAAGNDLLLLNDAGGVVQLTLGDRGRVANISFTDLPGGPDGGWSRPSRDTESFTRDPDSGQMWVGFERSNMIWRYSPDLKRAEAQAAPIAMRGWSDNGGAEAMLRLASGHFLVLPESAYSDGKRNMALLFDRDPTDSAARVTRFLYKPLPGFRPTDAAQLADGRVLVLHRRFTLSEFFTAKLAVIDPAEIREGATVRAREIAHFAPPVVADNFEALAVTQQNGRQILWMASDDNFRSPFQRNLVLKFAVDDEF